MTRFIVLDRVHRLVYRYRLVLQLGLIGGALLALGVAGGAPGCLPDMLSC